MSPGPRKAKTFELPPGKLRWRCPPSSFDFRTTADIAECPIDIIGQPRAIEALDLGLRVRAEGYNIFRSGHVGCWRSTIVRRMLVTIGGDARLARPSFTRTSLTQHRYTGAERAMAPFAAPEAIAVARFQVDGVPVTLRSAVRRREARSTLAAADRARRRA